MSTQTLVTVLRLKVNICKTSSHVLFVGKVIFLIYFLRHLSSNLIKPTASKFLLLDGNLHTTKLHSSQRLGGAFLFNLNPSIQLSRNFMRIWVQERGKKKVIKKKSSNCFKCWY